MVEILAAVCREFGAPLRVERLWLAPPGRRQVRVAVAACGICHSDVLFMRGAWGGTPPLVPGHEVAGRVVEAGVESGFLVGQAVIATLIRSCGRCRLCVRGAPALCEEVGALAVAPLLDAEGVEVTAMMNVGGFAEQVVVDASQVAVVPEAMPAEEAALLSCGGLTGWGAVRNTAPPFAGAGAAVVGCGGVGLHCVQAAAEAGAAPLCAVDLDAEALALAQRLGADCAMRVGEGGDDVAAARAVTGGRGFDFVYMAAGGARAVELAAELLAPLGTLVLAGMQADGDLPRLNATAIAHYQQRVVGCKMGGATLAVDVPALLEAYARGRLRLAPMVAGRYALGEVNAAVAAGGKVVLEIGALG